jgi:YD repeat-containing protein
MLKFDDPSLPHAGRPGAWRASYAYDALGRRISRQVPWAYDSDSRWTWYYHDGVRRVMEVNRDPLPQAGIGGNPEPQGSYVTYADREYVWGPDYVDECLWQVDRPGATAFVLQDANYNVVALVDPQGAMLAQYDYDPYGQPIAADTLGAFGHNRLGHQGLFADRYDTDAPAADLAVGAGLLYYARNRDYSPRLGRWVQRDPNGSAGLILDDIAGHGRQLNPVVVTADVQRMYRGGLSLHECVGSNTHLYVDPFGLEFTLVGALKAGGWGAAVGGASNATVAKLYSGKSWTETAVAGGKGAVAGFVGGTIGYSFGAAAAWAGFEGYGAMVIGSGVGGAGSGAASGVLNGRSAGEIGQDALWGGGIGLFSGLVGTGILARHDASGPAQQQTVEVLEWLYTDLFDYYFSAAASGYGAMADEVR